jgi:uncharacterized phage protein (TIGR02220 family)
MGKRAVLEHLGLQAMKLALRVAGFTSIQRLVLAAIASHADATGRAWPGEELLAAETGLGMRSVRNGVRGLERLGAVKVRRRGQQLPNEYALQLGVLNGLPRVRVTGTAVRLTGTTCRSEGDERPAPDDKVTGTTRQSDRHVVPPKGSGRAQGRDQVHVNGAGAPVAWLDLLNERARTSFKPTDANLRPIHARLREGHTFEEAERVVAAKTAEWGSTDFARYLRPLTLFGPKFDSYVQAASNGHVNRLPRMMSNWDGEKQGRV